MDLTVALTILLFSVLGRAETFDRTLFLVFLRRDK